MASEPELAANDLPKGWTNDPKDMEWDFYWNQDPDCMAKELENTYNIKLDQDSAVMCRTRRTGDMLYMIKTSDKLVYMWNMIEGSLVKVEHKGGEIGIISDMKNRGMSALTMTVMEQGENP